MGHGAAIVTGGSKRIGREIVTRLIKLGNPVVIHYNESEKDAFLLSSEMEQLGGKCVTMYGNFCDITSVKRFVEEASRKISCDVSILVNCASIFHNDSIQCLDVNIFQKSMMVNVCAPLELSSQLLMHVKQRETFCKGQASFINILDQKIAAPNGDHLSYTASRYALHGMTETLARVSAPFIRVNAVAPGHTLPSAGMTQTKFENIQRLSPLTYGPTPEDISEAVAYLVSAPAVTGQTLFVDSGIRFNARKRDAEFEV